VITIIFGTGHDIYLDRQAVAERLSTIAACCRRGSGRRSWNP